jgi:hypothetical protein
MASMSLRIRLGPLVYFSVDGENCHDLTAALDGFEALNAKVDAMCSDLAGRVYPDGDGGGDAATWPQQGPPSEEHSS